MATAYLQHIESGEIKEVEADSLEFHSLVGERDDSNRPVYQQQGAHVALAAGEAEKASKAAKK